MNATEYLNIIANQVHPFTAAVNPYRNRFVSAGKKLTAVDTTVGSIGVNTGQHSCETLSTPCRVHALTN
jgi:hypothetical protein